jgi:hypothetical protein
MWHVSVLGTSHGTQRQSIYQTQRTMGEPISENPQKYGPWDNPTRASPMDWDLPRGEKSVSLNYYGKLMSLEVSQGGVTEVQTSHRLQ